MVKTTGLLSFILAAVTGLAPHPPAAAETPSGVAEKARQLGESDGAAGGLIVQVGCGDGEGTAALAAGGEFLVQGLAASQDELDRARSRLMAEGLYGRVTVAAWDGERLPYVDDMVNFLVVEDRGRLSDEEMMRVVAPGGAAYVRSGGQWEEKVKPRPREIDEWTHWLHGPDNNAVSRDRRVGVSRSLQWRAPPRWTRHHNLPAGFNAMVSGGGRIYYLVDRAPRAVYGPGQWTLVARDAFNGLELWRKEIAEWGMEAWGATKRYGSRIGRFHGAPDYQAPRRLVVDGDRLFATLGFHAPVSALDGATGRLIREYPDTRDAGEIIYRDGTLYVARNTYEPTPGKEIMAVDADTGKTLWRNGDYKGIAAEIGYQQRYTDAFLTLGEKNLFLADENDIVALRLKDGREAWKSRMPLTDEIVGDVDYRYSNFCSLAYRDGRIFFAQIHPGVQSVNKWEMKKLEIEALDAETGRRLWRRTGGTLAHVTPPDLLVNRGCVWTFDPSLDANGDNDARLWGLNCETGEITTNYLLSRITHNHHHRCYRDKATENYYLMGEEGIEYVDFRTGASDVHYWLRGACRYGIMPANGFIYVPPHNCSCYLGTLVYGFSALKRSSSVPPRAEAPGRRLARGPAYESPPPAAVAAGPLDWPMFRHDPMRSCSTPAAVSGPLSEKWRAALGGVLTPPVIVSDRVFVSAADGCQVCSLSAATGKIQWRFAVDGPLNAPPTYAEGRLVVGTRAGTLYVLTAEEGKLIWRFHAGPARVQIAVCGRLESPWPLGGSPLVLHGSVYCVAGRSMSLDSGIYLYKLDLRSGRLLQQVQLETDTKPKGEIDNNFLAEMLVSDGESVFMRSIRFDAGDIARYEFASPPNRRGSERAPKEILRCQTDMLDDSWLNCCFWAYRGCQAQQLVFDDAAAYGINGPQRVTWGGSASHDVYWPGSGYRLHKWEWGGRPALSEKERQRRKRRGEGAGPAEQWPDVRVGVRAQSMLLTADRLYLAGVPDQTPAGAFWSAYEDRRGAVLLSVSKEDGRVLAKHDLGADPVYNGLAAARGRLYISMRDGTIACWGAP